jgi:serine/threonine-protein kinase
MRVGDTIAGKYRLDRVLGSGATSIVFGARHFESESDVAIKCLLPHVLGDETARARFFREAAAAASLDSEHVARVYESGWSEAGVPYLVMEYLDGEDLAQRLAKYGPPPLEQAIELALQVCEALAHGHGRGIVHRDLKPANLFCTRDEEGMTSIKVLDFGASRLLAPLGEVSQLTLSRVGEPIGSPLYMAPEQVHATDAVDTRADIWALGAILYELLTGRTPFTGAGVADVMMKIVMTAPLPPSQLQPSLPARLDEVLLRCLEKDPLLRFRNVGELALALAEFAPRRAQPSVDRITRRVASANTLGLTREEPALYAPGPITSPPLRAPSPPTMPSIGAASPSTPPPLVSTQAIPASTSPRRVATNATPASSTPPPLAATQAMRASVPPLAATQGMPASSTPPPLAATQGMAASIPPPLPATQGMPASIPPAPLRRRSGRDVALALLIVGGVLGLLSALVIGVLVLLGVL